MSVGNNKLPFYVFQRRHHLQSIYLSSTIYIINPEQIICRQVNSQSEYPHSLSLHHQSRVLDNNMMMSGWLMSVGSTTASFADFEKETPTVLLLWARGVIKWKAERYDGSNDENDENHILQGLPDQLEEGFWGFWRNEIWAKEIRPELFIFWTPRQTLETTSLL